AGGCGRLGSAFRPPRCARPRRPAAGGARGPAGAGPRGGPERTRGRAPVAPAGVRGRRRSEEEPDRGAGAPAPGTARKATDDRKAVLIRRSPLLAGRGRFPFPVAEGSGKSSVFAALSRRSRKNSFGPF